MSNNNCGCGPKQTQSINGEFLLVKATGQNASTCGEINDLDSANSDCAKQEPMFDFSKSDLIIPLSSSVTQMEVCNSDIYSIGMWIQFLNPITTMMISNITGNIVTLSNRCSNGEEIASNPATGTAITRGTRFVVCDAPSCETDAEQIEVVKEALGSMTELCLPLLEEASQSSVIHPVGRVESDPNNSSVKKCLKRIQGFVFRNGIPFFSNMNTAASSAASNYKKVARDKITGELVQIPSYLDYPGSSPTSPMAISVLSTEEKLVGPVYFSRPIFIDLFSNTDENDPNNWPISSATEISKTIDVSGLSIYQMERSRDSVYLTIRIDISARASNSNRIQIIVNGLSIAKYFAFDNDKNTCSFTHNVKVDDSDKKLVLRFNGLVDFKCYFKVAVIAYNF